MNTTPNPDQPRDPKVIRDIFLEVTQAPATQRAATLDRLCGEDAQLRADVDLLLRANADADADDFLSSPTLKASTTLPVITEGPGSRIGPYKLLQRIGEGGFGVVFMAEQERTVRRKVALKIIKPGMDSKAVIARFEAERQALALMDHPHIARVYDGGMTDASPTGGGRPYFVMEYVVGDSIIAFADAHKLDLRERLELLSQVCQAVQHAHTKGVIHRDLKPGNVLVSMVDGRPFAKVIDFGIAKSLASPLTEKTLFTEHRQLIGTPEYMSPEQAEGSPDIDTRTDVYALGVLLYELLTGLTPFDGKRLRSAAFDEMRRIIKDEDPPMPSQRLSRSLATLASTAATRRVEPTRLGTMLRGELDWIVMKSLEKDRARRYETPNQLAGDLQRHLSGEAVIAAPPRAGYRLRKFVRRNKGPVFAGTLVTAALLLGVAGTSVALVVAHHNANAATHNASIALSAQADLTEANAKLLNTADAAEWSAYTANLALAQSSMDAGNYPETRKRLANCPENKRGWEWEFLQLQASAVNWMVFGEHTFACFTPGGQPVLIPHTYSEDSTNDVLILNADSGTKESTLRVPSPWPVDYASVNSTGRLIALSCMGAQVLVLDTVTGELIATSPSLSSNTYDVSFAPEGDRLVVLAGQEALLWSVYGGIPPTRLIGHTNTVTCATFSPDGRWVATASADATVRMWDSETGDCVASRSGFDPQIAKVRFDPAGAQLLVSSRRGDVVLLDVLTDRPPRGAHNGYQLQSLARSSYHGRNGEFRPDGSEIVTVGSDGIGAQIWNTTTGKLLSEWAGRYSAELSDWGQASFHPESNDLLMQDRAGTDRFCIWTSPVESQGGPVRVLPAGGLVALRVESILGKAVESSSRELVAPDGTRRIAAGPDRTVRIFETASEPDPAKQRELAVIRVRSEVTDMHMTAESTRLVLSFADGSAQVWDIRDPSERQNDLEREWAERIPAAAHLDTLFAGPTSTDALHDAIVGDDSVTPLRRLVAAELLAERLDDMDTEAELVFDKLSEAHTDKPSLEAAAAAADLPPRVKQMVLARVAEWEYKLPRQASPATE